MGALIDQTRGYRVVLDVSNDAIQFIVFAHSMVEDSSCQKAFPVRPRIKLAFRAVAPFNHLMMVCKGTLGCRST